MKEILTIQIPRPNFEGMDSQTQALVAKEIANEITQQIIFQEKARRKAQEINYWQTKITDWMIEDQINEIKNGNHFPKPTC
jgi:hypothetical protein